MDLFVHIHACIAIDVVRKWIYAYNQLKMKNIAVVGFSSDCDARYLKAMQICLGFFTKTPNIDIIGENNDLFKISIPTSWNFFFMRNQQLFFCMQDGIHLATKLRNRLLSTVARLSINNHLISIDTLSYIIDYYSKIDHNLVKSDIYPRDRQNFSSCMKITSDDVLTLLEKIDAKGTFVYLYLLKLVIVTYVKTDTDIFERLYYGWIVTFAFRMWW